MRLNSARHSSEQQTDVDRNSAWHSSEQRTSVGRKVKEGISDRWRVTILCILLHSPRGHVASCWVTKITTWTGVGWVEDKKQVYAYQYSIINHHYYLIIKKIQSKLKNISSKIQTKREDEMI